MTGTTWQWGTAGHRMTAAGEGNPEMWREAGLVPCPGDREPGIVLGSFGDRTDELLAAPAFAAQPCIGQSSGDVRRLPVSVVWEVLLPMLLAAGRPGDVIVRINLAEEQLKYPRRAEQFARVADAVAGAAKALADGLGLVSEVRVNTRPPASAVSVDTSTLYGMFAPFQPEIDHPRGFQNEANILIAFTWYLARYRELPPGSCVVEGAHMVGAVRAALGTDARYLAALGLPAPSGRACLVQDAPAGERITMANVEDLPLDWWPEQVVRSVFGRGLRELALDFRDSLTS
ncbi:hypothetical protein AB0E83_09450 [Streptomyces sp. NPDC035033]|uniref:hypothetical protein n=1 Tax=Streptomyces sp. NPDC035033 TaxID=3155368 RepID=UPI0033FBA888